jgi:hypothetical protein
MAKVGVLNLIPDGIAGVDSSFIAIRREGMS